MVIPTLLTLSGTPFCYGLFLTECSLTIPQVFRYVSKSVVIYSPLLLSLNRVLISPPHNPVGLQQTPPDSTRLSGQPYPLLNHSKQPDCSPVESGGVQWTHHTVRPEGWEKFTSKSGM